MKGLLTERAQFLVECLDLEAATGVPGARWEAFQLEHLNYDGIFSIENKSRQVAWSWLSAAEGTAFAVLNDKVANSSVFTSINLDEAKEKIRYAKAVYENLQVGGKPKLIRDNELLLEFDNGARLISHPNRAPRGKARMNWYGDEFAHVQGDRDIYKGALPIASKGGRIRLGSSPLGASGLFWEIYTETMRKYPGYRRKRTPWWEVQAFCKNVAEAKKLAPAMPTAHRVEVFGRDSIQAIYANVNEEDFKQEYEATFVDESTAWISWDEIRNNQDAGLEHYSATAKEGELGAVMEAIDAFMSAVQSGSLEASYGCGVDVGRTRNTTEVFLVGQATTGSSPLRLMLSLDNCDFDAQAAVISQLLQAAPIVKCYVDNGGIGRNLCETLEKDFPHLVEAAVFTQQTKALWATDAKMFAQQRKCPLPVDRDLAYQIHSIKKLVTASKNVVFDTERNEKHHADMFWAWALALNAAKTTHQEYEPQRPRGTKRSRLAYGR